MKQTYWINEKKVTLACDDRLGDTAAFFASILEREDTEYHVLEDGRTLQIGWGFYRVLKMGEEYRVTACDLAGDPFRDVTEDLSQSLEVFSWQRELLNKTGAVPQETSFQDTMLAQKAAVRAPAVYLQRGEPGGPGDSGWYLGSLSGEAPEDPGEYIKLYTYQLLRFCPKALAAIQLPVGTICVLENGEIVEIVDQNDQKIF